MKFSLVTALALISITSASPLASTECKGKQTIQHTYIGPNKDVSAEYYSCGSDFASRSLADPLEKRQNGTNNQCGAACTTNCFSPSGGGPDPNDCQVIAGALLYDSQNIGPLFTIAPAGNGSVNYIKLSYATCNSTFVNQDNSTMTYCRSDWAGVTGDVGDDCQAAQNAHGGNCVANDQQFFIQVEHS